MKSKERRLTVLFFSLWAFFILAVTIFGRVYLYAALTPLQGLAAALAFCAVVLLPLLFFSNHFAGKCRWKVFSIITLILIIHHLLAVLIGTTALLIKYVL